MSLIPQARLVDRDAPKQPTVKVRQQQLHGAAKGVVSRIERTHVANGSATVKEGRSLSPLARGASFISAQSPYGATATADWETAERAPTTSMSSTLPSRAQRGRVGRLSGGADAALQAPRAPAGATCC